MSTEFGPRIGRSEDCLVADGAIAGSAVMIDLMCAGLHSTRKQFRSARE